MSQTISGRLIILIIYAVYGPIWSNQTSQSPLNNEYLPPRNEYLPPKNEYLPPKDEYGPPNHTPGKPITLIDDDALTLPSNNFYSTMKFQKSEPSCPPNNPEANRKLVLKAYQHAFGNKNISGIENFYHEDYIQHNPMIPDGLNSIRKLLSSPGVGGPVKIEIMRNAAEGDLVWTHSKLPFFGRTYAAVDIFRIECGKIKEHWDVLQDTQLQSPSMNSHPFF